jgi:hypothetical protein
MTPDLSRRLCPAMAPSAPQNARPRQPTSSAEVPRLRRVGIRRRWSFRLRQARQRRVKLRRTRWRTRWRTGRRQPGRDHPSPESSPPSGEVHGDGAPWLQRKRGRRADPSPESFAASALPAASRPTRLPPSGEAHGDGAPWLQHDGNRDGRPTMRRGPERMRWRQRTLQRRRPGRSPYNAERRGAIVFVDVAIVL